MLVLFAGKSRISCRFVHSPPDQSLSSGIRPFLDLPSGSGTTPEIKALR
jgi:hypothetical protein